jgi:hypothetical protein
MNPLQWPRTTDSTNLPDKQDLTSLPPLELNESDYEAASEAFRELDDCFFEVVFIHEVAARHCRERQLRAALSQNKPLSDHAHTYTAINRRQKLTYMRRPD